MYENYECYSIRKDLGKLLWEWFLLCGCYIIYLCRGENFYYYKILYFEKII